MANLLNQNPIIITLPQTSYKAAVATTLGTLFTLRVDKIVWQNPTAAGNTVLITDPNSGENLVRLIAQAAGVPQTLDFTPNAKGWIDFAVPQIDSGILQIYLR